MNGQFIISLDFELHWGVFEVRDVNHSREYFLNTRKVIPLILSLFEKYDIACTWATVGFLFANSKKQLEDFKPRVLPSYYNSKLNYYDFFNQVGDNEKADPFHFAPSLIEKILETSKQELASHTFSHYYCLEKGNSEVSFREDLLAAQHISKTNFGVQLESLVLPRNQFEQNYLKVIADCGFKTVRNNPDVWFWKTENKYIASFSRAMDTIVPISKSLCFSKAGSDSNLSLIPASRFFRPYSKKEEAIQNLKIKRIKNEMLHAAKNNLHYHLWWHPHNFGNYLQKNLEQLEDLLKYYQYLNHKFGFTSVSMKTFNGD